MERIKIWTAIDRNRNKVVAFELSINSNNNDSIICRRLLNKVRNVDSNTYINNNNNSSISNNNIDNKNNKNKEILIDIIATDGNYSYNKVINTKGTNKDCNRYIISKSETCLVEAWNSSLRGTSDMFIRRTKCYAKSIKSIYNGVLFWQHKDFIKKNIREIINNYWRKSYMYK